MNFLFEWMRWIDWNMNRPVSYQSLAVSWFHYASLVLILIYTLFFSWKYKNASPKQFQRFVFLTGIYMALFELIRNLFFTYLGDGVYPWYIFPFQFCSTPIFVSLAMGLTKPGKFQDSLYTYLGSFSLLAGILVLALPNDIYIDKVIINLQTTYQHGSMIVLGLVLVFRKIKWKLDSMIYATGIFAFFVIMAMLLNTWHNEFIQEGVFNMFYINPVYGSTLPVFNVIYTWVPYPVFLAIYVLLFGIGASFILWFFSSIQKSIQFLLLIKLSKKSAV
jgi:hypothetical protein